MEKVTFPPLIALLQESSESLNQILGSAHATNLRLNSEEIPAWFKEVIEPVFQAIYDHNQALSRKVFDALFRDMLAALSVTGTMTDLNMLKQCRLLLKLNPAVTAANPDRVLKSLNTAVTRIYKHSQPAARLWISLMQKIVPLVKTHQELLSTGRVAAWRCGMAHLRELIDCPASINAQISALIFADENCTPDKLKNRWGSDAKITHFAAGGFTGFGGLFARPPRVAVEGGHVFVSDGLRTAALFSDRYGSVFQESPETTYESLSFSLEPIDKAPLEVAKILSRYPDLTSWVYHEATLFFTTSSSHAVFISGAVDG